MCTSVRFNGERIDRYGELVRALGIDNVILDPADQPMRGDDCLCPVDMDATIEAAGLVEIEHDGDPMERHLIRRTPTDERYLAWWKKRWGDDYPRKLYSEPADSPPHSSTVR